MVDYCPAFAGASQRGAGDGRPPMDLGDERVSPRVQLKSLELSVLS